LIASVGSRTRPFSALRKNAIVKTRLRRWLGTAVGLGVGVGASSGCGGTLYSVTAYSAQSKIETAQALGAERYAPYEYYYAKEHLLKAQEEAASADYGDAIDFAGEAEKFAEKAIALSKQAHEGAGR
jgi:hypothetical protein